MRDDVEALLTLGVIDRSRVDEAQEQALGVVTQEGDGLHQPVHRENEREFPVG